MSKGISNNLTYKKRGNVPCNPEKTENFSERNPSAAKKDSELCSGSSNTLKPSRRPTPRKLFGMLENDYGRNEGSKVSEPPLSTEKNIPDIKVCLTNTDFNLQKIAPHKFKKNISKPKSIITMQKERQTKVDILYSKYLRNIFLEKFLSKVHGDILKSYDEYIVRQIHDNDDLEESIYLTEHVLNELLHVQNSLLQVNSLKTSVNMFIERFYNNIFNFEGFGPKQLHIANIHFCGSKADLDVLLNSLFFEEGLFGRFSIFPSPTIFSGISTDMQKTVSTVSEIKSNINMLDDNLSMLFMLFLQICSNSDSLGKVFNRVQQELVTDCTSCVNNKNGG